MIYQFLSTPAIQKISAKRLNTLCMPKNDRSIRRKRETPRHTIISRGPESLRLSGIAHQTPFRGKWTIRRSTLNRRGQVQRAAQQLQQRQDLVLPQPRLQCTHPCTASTLSPTLLINLIINPSICIPFLNIH